MSPSITSLGLGDHLQVGHSVHGEATSFFLSFFNGSKAKKAAKAAAAAQAAEEEANRVPPSERMENAVESAHEAAYEAAQAAQASKYATQQARTSSSAAEAASAELGFLLQRKREMLSKAKAALRSPRALKPVAKPPQRTLPSRRHDGPSDHGALQMMAREQTLGPLVYLLPDANCEKQAFVIGMSHSKRSADAREKEANSFLLLNA